MNEHSKYELTLSMEKEQVKWFYVTMSKAYKNWPGGEPIEQQVLSALRDESWKLLLETQFEK